MAGTINNKTHKKTDIINAVTSPLGFFVLIVLVVEVIFGITASMSAGSDRTYLILGLLLCYLWHFGLGHRPELQGLLKE